MKSERLAIQMTESNQQYISMVLSIVKLKVVVTFYSVEEILKCDHLNDIYLVELSSDPVFIVYKWFEFVSSRSDLERKSV